MTMKGNSAAAAPLAIVDGTYLCLLPPALNDDDAQDVLIYVPALPCVDVWKHCGPKTVDVNEMTVDDDEPHCDMLPNAMDTIPIRLSDISKHDFRFIYPMNLLNNDNKDGSSSLVQISSCNQDNIAAEGRMTWSNNHDNNCLDIRLPSMVHCDDGEHDFECFEEDDDCDVYGDTSCIDSLQHCTTKKNLSNKQSSTTFQVHGGGSCITADFTGIGGYEQALILPQLELSLILEAESISKSSNNESGLNQMKGMLQNILENSILTDGSSVFLPRNTEINAATDSMDNVIFNLAPVNSLSQRQQEQSAVSSQQPNRTDMGKESHNQQKEINDEGTNEDIGCSSVPPKDAAWLEAIEQTIESRLAKQVAGTKQLERTAQVRSDLIEKGRETLHKACRLNSASGSADVSNDPQLLRLRYGTRPRMSSDAQQGLSAVIDLELDIHLQNNLETEQLHGFHVSCTLASSSEQHSVLDSIRTQSGIVPVLQNGDCVTILASVSLNELKFDFHTNSNSSALDLNIQGLWLDKKLQKRQGSVLCLLRLPLKSVLFSPSTLAKTRAGHCIQHEIDFSCSEKGGASRLVPIAVFDYRHPHTINIDISASIGLQDGKIWKDLVSKLNSHISMTSFIDLYYKKGDPTLKLVIFASNPAEQAAITCLVLQSLPENVKLFDHDPNEAKSVKALLVSLKNEAETFQKHRMSKGTVSAEMRKEMALLQASTDLIASTIKRGWA